MNEPNNNATQFYAELLRAVPEFRPIFDERFAYYEEIQSVLFLSDLADFLLGQTSDEPGGRIPPDQLDAVVKRTADFLERRLEIGDRMEVEMILTGFVEGLLGDHDEAREAIRPLFGPKLERALGSELRRLGYE